MTAQDDTMNFYFNVKHGFKYTGENFVNVSVDGLELQDTNLEGIVLKNCTFYDCDFSGCSFRAAELTSCVFHGCNLSGTIFEEVQAQGISFSQCNLNKSTFINSDFSDTVFTESRGKEVDFTFSFLAGTIFYKCSLRNSDFTGTANDKVKFIDSDISGSKITQSTSVGDAIVNRTNITGVDFFRAPDHASIKYINPIIDPYVESYFSSQSVQQEFSPRLYLNYEVHPLVPENKKDTYSPSRDNYVNMNYSRAAVLYCACLKEYKEYQ